MYILVCVFSLFLHTHAAEYASFKEHNWAVLDCSDVTVARPMMLFHLCSRWEECVGVVLPYDDSEPARVCQCMAYPGSRRVDMSGVIYLKDGVKFQEGE